MLSALSLQSQRQKFHFESWILAPKKFTIGSQGSKITHTWVGSWITRVRSWTHSRQSHFEHLIIFRSKWYWSTDHHNTKLMCKNVLQGLYISIVSSCIFRAVPIFIIFRGLPVSFRGMEVCKRNFKPGGWHSNRCSILIIFSLPWFPWRNEGFRPRALTADYRSIGSSVSLSQSI